MPKPSVCAVTLNTWGTHEGGGNGMMHYMDTKLFGGNVGHASLSVTFPVNAQTSEWIRKYCIDPAIPFEKQKIVTQKAELDPQGKYSPQKDALFEEEVYTVNFSWFPGAGGYGLSPSLNSDSINEREGVASEMSPRFREYLGQEQRVHKGKLGERTIHYGVKSIEHERALNDDQKAMLQIRATQNMIMLSTASLDVLSDKLNTIDEKFKERDKRLIQLADKSNVLNKHNQTLLTLLKLTNDLKADKFSPAQYTNQQTAELEKVLGARLDSFAHENQAERSAFISKIEAAQIKLRAEMTQLRSDTAEKIAAEYANTSQLTLNTIATLDKELPSWRQDIQCQSGPNLNEAQLELLEKIVEKKRNINTEQAEQLTQQSKELAGKLNSNDHAKVEILNKRISEKEQELKEVNYLIHAKPLDKDLHHKVLMLDKEINDLKSEIATLKKTDNYQYHHLQSTVIADWQKLAVKLDELLSTDQNAFSNADGSAPLSYSMIKSLDSAFENLINKDELKAAAQHKLRAKVGWKNNHIASHDRLYNQITREEASALKDYVKQQIVASKETALTIQPAVSSIEQADFENYLTTGARPDNVVKMEIDQAANFTNGNPNGMNVEAMLKEMHSITTEGKKFDINANNCSVTVGRVLAAGAKNEHLKSKFENKALGAIGNPQKVYNNAQKYADAMQDPNDSFMKRVARIDPLKAAKGWCVKTLFVDKEASTGKKVLAGIAAVPVALAQGAVTGFKKIISPIKSINELINFNRYAQSRPSLGFKIGAAVLSAPAFAVLAIPAAIGTATNKFNDALGAISKAFSKRRQSHLSDNVDLKNEDIGKGLTIEANIQSALKDNVVTIHAKNLKDALLQFKSALESQNGPVVLDKKTENAVLKQIAKIKDPVKQSAVAKEYDELCQESIARITAIQRPILAASGITQNPSTSQVAQPQQPVPPSNSDDLVLVKPATFAKQQQFYSVMPILGKELAQQIESYANYEPPIAPSKEKQNSSGLPRTVNPNTVASNDGYLASKAERDYVIDYFNKHSDAKELRAGVFPDDHPLKGQPIGEAFKDNHGNIYIMNEAILGKGGYGTVKVIQAIETPNPGHGVVEGQFYVAKIQDIDHSDPDRTLNAIQGEMNISAQFGLHLGEMIIEHDVLKALPVYQLPNSAPVSAPLPVQENETSAANEADLDADENKNLGTFSPKNTDEDNENLGTFRPKDTDEDNENLGTFRPQSTSIASTSKESEPTAPNFWANYKPPPDQLPNDTPKVKHTLEYYADLQPATATIDAAEDLSSFDTLKFLTLFEKMTEQVETVHAKGVLHRDIKAENFLYDAQKNEMRLIDFGCSKRLDDPTIQSPKKMCIGSAANFSPEHFHSDYKENISTKQDIYALARTFSLLMAKDMQKLNPAAYVDGLPTPAVPSEIQDQITSPFMENFRFNNANNDPRAKIMNQMLDLMHEMTNMRVNSRPEASDVRLRLQGLISEYKLVVAAEQRQQNTIAAHSQPVAPGAMAMPVPIKQPSLMEQNVQQNLYMLDRLASRHPDCEPLISYAKQGLKDALDIDQAMTRLLSELSKSKTPKDPQLFTADLVRTFDQMKKTPMAVSSAFAATESAPDQRQIHEQRSPPFTTQFSNATNNAKPMLATSDRAMISQNVQANLNALDELTERFYVTGEQSTISRMVNYIKSELDGAPNPEANMERLVNELIDDKRISSRDGSPSFKAAVKEIFTQMKSPANKADEPSASSASNKL